MSNTNPLRTRVPRQIAQSLVPAGQTQQHDTDIFHHGQQHLAHDLCLYSDIFRGTVRVLAGGQEPETVEPVHAIDELVHGGAKSIDDGLVPLTCTLVVGAAINRFFCNQRYRLARPTVIGHAKKRAATRASRSSPNTAAIRAMPTA